MIHGLRRSGPGGGHVFRVVRSGGSVGPWSEGASGLVVHGIGTGEQWSVLPRNVNVRLSCLVQCFYL